MIRRWSAAVVVLGLFLAACSSEPDDDPPQGVDVARLTAEVNGFLAAVDQAGKVRAVLIYHDGAPVLEQYTRSTPADYWPVKSMTKAVTTALVGIAVQQGYLSGLDETLDEMLLPSHAAAMTPDVAAITLRRLLTNTAGLPNEWAGHYDMWASKDWVRTILADRVASGPGDGSFAYSHAGVHLLAAILTEATGQSLLDFARANLFDPFGIPTKPAFVEPIVVRKAPGESGPPHDPRDGPDPCFRRRFRVAGRSPRDQRGFLRPPAAPPGPRETRPASTSTTVGGGISRWCPRRGSTRPPPRKSMDSSRIGSQRRRRGSSGGG